MGVKCLIVDRLMSNDGSRHQFDLYQHLAPGASIDGRGSSVTIRANDRSAALALLSSRPTDLKVLDNKMGADVAWVTAAYLKRTAAPVLRATIQAHDAWFATLITPAGSIPEFEVTGDPSGILTIEVRDQGSTRSLTLSPAGDVSFGGA